MMKESFVSRKGKSYTSDYYDYFNLSAIKDLIEDDGTEYEEELGQLYPPFLGAEVYSLKNGSLLVAQADCASIYPDLETFSAWIMESKTYEVLVRGRKTPFIIGSRMAEVLIETAEVKKDPEVAEVVYLLLRGGNVIFDETAGVYQFHPR